MTPLQEATDRALDFMSKFKDISLSKHATDTMRTTKVIADAKMHYSNNNIRLKTFIGDSSNSKTVVFNIFTNLKDSTLPAAERQRNEQLMRLFVLMEILPFH